MKFKNSVRSFGFWPLISALRPPASDFCKNKLRLWPRNPALVNGGPDSPCIEKEIELKNQNYE